MREPSFGVKFFVVNGFVTSLSAFVWLIKIMPPKGALPVLGFVSAQLSTGGALAFFWAAVFAYVIRKRNWRPNTCNLASFPFIVPGFLQLWFTGHSFADGVMMVSLGLLASSFCRRLAFPNVKPEEMYVSPPPLSPFRG